MEAKDDELRLRASSTGTGTAFNLVTQDALKPFMYLMVGTSLLSVIISVVALVVSLVGAPMLLAKSETISEKSENLTRYMVQVSYWGQRAELAATNAGLKLPPFPKQPKE
jgi:hypothetical protein